MKNILITGINSYVGNNLESWLKQYPDKYTVDKISVRDDKWREKDFSQYDSIVHVAGIAHRKETKGNEQLYYEVNRDLTIQLAEKAKEDKVKQFIFLSTMSIYGLETGVIDYKTLLKPKTYYGKSKLEAEEYIQNISTKNFNVAILRPPMIYGKNCPGNYQKLRMFAKKTPIFPNINNERSMIYIDNLSMYIEWVILNKRDGIYLPQNKDYINTSHLVKEVAIKNGKKICLISIFNFIIKRIKMNTINKVFGTLIYKYNEFSYLEEFYNFKETIQLTEE